MAEMVSLPERVRAGEAALARGAWDQARAIFEQELEARETVEALEGLSWAAWWVEDVPTCLEARERAYRRRHFLPTPSPAQPLQRPKRGRLRHRLTSRPGP